MPDIPKMESYLARGHAVHEWTQELDEGLTVRPPDAYAGYCEAYKNGFCNTFAPSWTHIEQPFDNGQWHGVIDRVGYIRGHDSLCVADIKTGSGKGKENKRRIATQLASYAMGWSPHSYEKVLRIGIFLMVDGTWRTEVYDDPRDFERWQQLLAEAKRYGKPDKETIEDTRTEDGQPRHGSVECSDNERRYVLSGVQLPEERSDDEEDHHGSLQANQGRDQRE
jgi:hypothetical protein